MRAEHLTQRRMYEMSRRVIASRRITLLDIYFSRYCVSNFDSRPFRF